MHQSLKPNAELNGAFDFAFIHLLGAFWSEGAFLPALVAHKNLLLNSEITERGIWPASYTN